MHAINEKRIWQFLDWVHWMLWVESEKQSLRIRCANTSCSLTMSLSKRLETNLVKWPPAAECAKTCNGGIASNTSCFSAKNNFIKLFEMISMPHCVPPQSVLEMIVGNKELPQPPRARGGMSRHAIAWRLQHVTQVCLNLYLSQPLTLPRPLGLAFARLPLMTSWVTDVRWTFVLAMPSMTPQAWWRADFSFLFSFSGSKSKSFLMTPNL